MSRRCTATRKLPGLGPSQHLCALPTPLPHWPAPFAYLPSYRDQEGDPRPATSAAPADAAPKLSFWGVASALTATVKARTAEVLTAVQETDWRAELEAFQQVGAWGSCHATIAPAAARRSASSTGAKPA